MIIGVDPATKLPAYGVMTELGELTDFGKIELTLSERWIKLFRYADVVGIEAISFMREHVTGVSRMPRMNIKTLLALSRASGILAGYTLAAGAKLFTVTPTVWQKRIIKLKSHAQRPLLKRMSKEIASAIAGQRINDPDIADAILITEFTRQKYLSGGIR